MLRWRLRAQLTWVDRLARRLEAQAPREVNDPARARAAVALIVTPEHPEAVLLMRRAEHPGDPWSGQMALPGGRWSPGDPDLRATAIRETIEELDLDLRNAPFLGTLDDLAPSTRVLPAISVRPHVFLLEGRKPLKPNMEVSATTWTPLSTLFHPDTWRPYTWSREGSTFATQGYYLPEGVVWGMTERILTPFLSLLDPHPLAPSPARRERGN